MAISFSCQSCGKALRVKDSMAGKRAKCPDCGYNIRVPEGNSPADSRKPVAPAPESDPSQFDFSDSSRPRSRAAQIPVDDANPFSAPPASGGHTPGPIRRRRLVRVGVLSLATVGAAAGALGGLILGVLFFLFSLVSLTLPRPQTAGALGGLVMLILFPLIYGVGGFLGGLLYGAVYNVVAGVTGGIEFEVE